MLFLAAAVVVVVFFYVVAVVSYLLLFFSQQLLVYDYFVHYIFFVFYFVFVILLQYVLLKVHLHNLLVIEQVLYQHKDDIVLKDLQVNEKVMLYNNLFDHEVVQQIQHVMNNQYLYELMEEVKVYL
jgi:hypothetical protein